MTDIELTDIELIAEHPWLALTAPQPVYDGPVRHLACRLCIVRHGLDPVDVPDLPRTPVDWVVHMVIEHPTVVPRLNG